MPWALAMVEEALALALAWRKTSWMRMALEAQQVVAQQKVRFPGQPGIPKPKQANRQLLMGHLPKVHQTQLSDPDPRLLPSQWRRRYYRRQANSRRPQRRGEIICPVIHRWRVPGGARTAWWDVRERGHALWEL